MKSIIHIASMGLLFGITNNDIWKQLKEMTTTKVNNFTINNMAHNGVTSQN